jgi:glycosyltransferase involved in cell wall biosynthesis
MPRFAKMLSDGMQKRGHKTEIWQPQPIFFKLSKIGSIRKWLGYIDQFLIFPVHVKKKLKRGDSSVLFVFTDHALGPWVPLVKDRPHIIHCHDFLAQRSALNKIKENPTSFTGRMYQKFIRNGYSKGNNFISVSNKTNEDLQEFLVTKPNLSEVVYNGLNRQFMNVETREARASFGEITGIDLSSGYLLHVGGNQWYKNRIGVIEIYESWRNISNLSLPLLLIGKSANPGLARKKEMSQYAEDIFFLTNITDQQLQVAYAGARLLLYPSLAEGFGWPIVEAMASGCPVITTNEAPMTEVAAEAAFLIRRKPENKKDIMIWADEAARVVNQIVDLPQNDLEEVIKSGIANAMRFETEAALDKIEKIYNSALKCYQN